MRTKEFAVKMQVNYRTALNWLRAGIVPGAELQPSPFGDGWDIPEAALTMARPRRGPIRRELSLVDAEAILRDMLMAQYLEASCRERLRGK